MTPDQLAQAACRDLDTALFFPVDGRPSPEALAACGTCPVAAPCAADRGDDSGLRAGRMVVERPHRHTRPRDCRICGETFRSTGVKNTLCGAPSCRERAADQHAEWNRTRPPSPVNRHRDGLGRWAS